MGKDADVLHHRRRIERGNGGRVHRLGGRGVAVGAVGVGSVIPRPVRSRREDERWRETRVDAAGWEHGETGKKKSGEGYREERTSPTDAWRGARGRGASREQSMTSAPTLVDSILAGYGIRGPWIPLPATGVANRIYATHDVVLRIATDHADAVDDARTESVAAPVARAAGIRTPRLIAFDDSRALVDRPFSLWERVHGETLGLIGLRPSQLAETWYAVGAELARLHLGVTECPDPNGYLDTPGRPLDLASQLGRMRDDGRIDRATAHVVESLIDELVPHQGMPEVNRYFLHDDIHAMNVMCTPAGELLALIDWGDAGWGDPTLELAAVPLAFILDVVAGYEATNPGGLGEFPAARLIWDKLHYALRDLAEDRARAIPLDALRRFVDGRGGTLP